MKSSYGFLTLLASVMVTSNSYGGVLVLKNGDRISGEIKQIWDAEVLIEPSYADEFTVDMEVIEYIESDRKFEIELSDGREIEAQPVGVDTEGNQLLLVDGEEVAVTVASLYELDEIDDYFDWETFVDWSAAINSGNTDSLNNRLAANTTLRMGDHRHFGDLTISREEQNQESIKEQDLIRYNYNWIFSDPWFLSAAYSFERDPIRQLDRRSVFTAGIGRDIWNTPRLMLNFQLAAGAIAEEIDGGSEDSTVLSWVLRYRQDLFSEDLEVFHNQQIIQYLSGRDNTIYKTSTGLRYEITDLLYANASLDYDYETQPAATAQSEDITLLFGLGIEF